jgi:hypothetical protein
VLNSNGLDGWEIYNGWMMQETSRKYIKPTCIKNGVREDPRLGGKTGIVTWRQVVLDRDGWRGATGEVLILLG